MITEEEAKTKWCPFARVSNTGLGNRYPMDIDLAEGHAFARCIASTCMAWRRAAEKRIERRVMKGSNEHTGYLHARFPDGKSHHGTFEFDGHRWQYEYSSFDDSGEFDLLTRPSTEGAKIGFCGLAGQP